MPELRFARYRTESKYTHYLFRFPAKFHPPAVRCLLERFSKPGQTVLDPFCGSGTLLVEALLYDRQAIGIDVDPVAAFISRVKSSPISPLTLRRAFERLHEDLQRVRRTDANYDRLMHADLSPRAIARYRDELAIPAIPNIAHWFRTYVILDLARIRTVIRALPAPPRVQDFFLACFASIIRNASNADPVPVSGLEVTAHMKALDSRGRRIDPFELFERRVERELLGMAELWDGAGSTSVKVQRGDATRLTRHVRAGTVDVVITSPPYNTAVDYYRRHTLEMYWLDMVKSHDERLELAPHYLGRVQIRQSNPKLKTEFDSEYVKRLISHASQVSSAQERAVRHYCASMRRTLEHIARILKPRGKAVFVVGNSKWNGRRIRATRLLGEIAKDHFEIAETYSYTTRNRYMSYERHNGANVNREYALVLKKRPR